MKSATEKRNLQFNKMTTAPVGNLLLSLSIPTILTMMVTNIYSIADTGFVGTLGTSQSGATGVVFGFMTILQALGFLCGQGAGSTMSRKLGEKNIDEANTYTTTGFFMSFGLGLLSSIIGFCNMDRLLVLLGSTPTIAPYARVYMTFILIVAPFITSSFTLNNILRYEGKAKLGTIGMLTGAFLNIGLDAILMFVFDMGIMGAGIATMSSQIISFFILFGMFHTKTAQTRISFKFLPRSFFVVWTILTIGFPSLLRQGLTGVAAMILNNQAGFYGDAAVSAMSIVSRISFFPLAIALGIGQGFQPISSFNYGAGKKDRVRKAFFSALLASEIALAVTAIPIFITAPQLINLLREDIAVIEIGTRALRLMCVANLFMPLTMMVEMGYQSIGVKLLAILASSLRSGLILIPSLLILSNTRGLSGIQEAQPISIVISFLICIALFKVYLNKLK